MPRPSIVLQIFLLGGALPRQVQILNDSDPMQAPNNHLIPTSGTLIQEYETISRPADTCPKRSILSKEPTIIETGEAQELKWPLVQLQS